jgi:hypothetical protein
MKKERKWEREIQYIIVSMPTKFATSKMLDEELGNEGLE